MHLINRHLFSRIHIRPSADNQQSTSTSVEEWLLINLFVTVIKMVCLPVPAQVFAKQGPVRTIALVHHPHVVSVAECVEEKVKEGREREEHATKYIVFVFFAPNGLSSSCVRCHCVLARSLRIIRQASCKSCGVMANDLVPCCSRSAASNPTKGKVRWDEPPPLIQLRFASWKSPTR